MYCIQQVFYLVWPHLGVIPATIVEAAAACHLKTALTLQTLSTVYMSLLVSLMAAMSLPTTATQ